jgi:hypothetical protein
LGRLFPIIIVLEGTAPRGRRPTNVVVSKDDVIFRVVVRIPGIRSAAVLHWLRMPIRLHDGVTRLGSPSGVAWALAVRERSAAEPDGDWIICNYVIGQVCIGEVTP